MLWLIFCGLFLLMLFNIFGMLRQRGKWAWILFLGLIASAGAYVGLVVLPLAYAAASMEGRRGWLLLLLFAATMVYLGGLFYFVRKVGSKLKNAAPPSNDTH